MATTALGSPTVDDVVSFRDPAGVIAVHVGVDPAEQATDRPRWEIELDAALGTLRERVRAEGPRARAVALDRRLRELAPALGRLVDPAEHGRGRALFAGLSSGETHTVSLQVPLPTEATLGEVPRVMPLLAATAGGRSGLVLVGRDRVRVLETWAGEAEELEALDVEPVVEDGAERKGPAAANPLRAQQVVTQRERYARHVEAVHRRALAGAAQHVAGLAGDRGWRLAVVAGDPRGGNALLEALAAAHVEAEAVDRDLVELTPAQALVSLAPALAGARGRRDLALALAARDAASWGGRGALGLADVLGALAEARVEELVLDGDRSFEGAIAPDGRLVPAGVRPAGVAAQDLRPEPLLADRMALRALETSARVAVVDGEAAAALADADGVAAILRW